MKVRVLGAGRGWIPAWLHQCFEGCLGGGRLLRRVCGEE